MEDGEDERCVERDDGSRDGAGSTVATSLRRRRVVVVAKTHVSFGRKIANNTTQKQWRAMDETKKRTRELTWWNRNQKGACRRTKTTSKGTVGCFPRSTPSSG